MSKIGARVRCSSSHWNASISVFFGFVCCCCFFPFFFFIIIIISSSSIFFFFHFAFFFFHFIIIITLFFFSYAYSIIKLVFDGFVVCTRVPIWIIAHIQRVHRVRTYGLAWTCANMQSYEILLYSLAQRGWISTTLAYISLNVCVCVCWWPCASISCTLFRKKRSGWKCGGKKKAKNTFSPATMLTNVWMEQLFAEYGHRTDQRIHWLKLLNITVVRVTTYT